MFKALLSGGSRSVDEWRAIVSDLESRLAGLRQAIESTVQDRSALAQKAATGDLEARVQLDRANKREAGLWAEFDAVQPAMAKAQGELAALTDKERYVNRRSGLAALRKALAERAEVAAEVENLLQALAQDIGKLFEHTAAARQIYGTLVGAGVQTAAATGNQPEATDGAVDGGQATPAGHGPMPPAAATNDPLSEAAVAARLSRFGAALGLNQCFGAGGTNAPLKSLLDAEMQAHQAYLKQLDSAGKHGG
jgi:hypothetical protein